MHVPPLPMMTLGQGTTSEISGGRVLRHQVTKRVEEMYAPEVFGRGSSKWVTVE
jgi:hypothetical protein